MEIKIKLKIKDVELELSEKETRELHDILDHLVDQNGRIMWYPYYPYYPFPSWEPYKVTWSDSGTTNTITITNNTSK